MGYCRHGAQIRFLLLPPGTPARERVRQVFAQIACVITDPVNERRFAPTQKGCPHQVHAREINDPAEMVNHAFAIENG